MKFVVLCLVPLLCLVQACATQEAYDDTKRELSSQDDVIQELRQRNEGLIAKQRSLETDLKAAQAEVAALRTGKETVDKDVAAMKNRLRSFEERFGKWDAEFGVRLKAHAEGVALEVKETLLFAVGKATLTAKGKQLLEGLAPRLAEHPGKIRVDGHTDDQPVVIHKKEFPMGNLQLSGRRALVVADFLLGKSGLEPGKISFAGFGEHRPVVANARGDARARNRRVEIVLLSGSGR